MLLTGRQGRRQLRAIRPLAGFHLGELGDQLPAAAIEIVQHGLPLGLEAKARFTLPVGRNPVIGDEFASMCCHGGLPNVSVGKLYHGLVVLR
jgi:hypothetical protein